PATRVDGDIDIALTVQISVAIFPMLDPQSEYPWRRAQRNVWVSRRGTRRYRHVCQRRAVARIHRWRGALAHELIHERRHDRGLRRRGRALLLRRQVLLRSEERRVGEGRGCR